MAFFNPYYNSNRFSGGNPSAPNGAINGQSFMQQTGGDAVARTPDSSEIIPPTQQDNNNNNTSNNIGAGVAIAANGLQTYQGERAKVNGFDINNMAGLEGGASGAATGLSTAGPWGALIGGIVGTVAGSIGTVSGVNDKVKKLNTGVNGVSYNQFGQPQYNGQAIINARTNASALTHGIHENYQTSDITGTRWIGEALFNTRSKMRRKRAQLKNNIQAAQNNYNNAETISNQNYVAQQTYQNSLNNTNRLYNLYHSNTI